jgi:hypothetical protein
MNTFTATLLLETGQLRHVHIMAPTAHEARRIIASWIGKQHTDAVRLVNLAGVGITPRHRAPSPTAQRSLLAAMISAGLLLLLLLLILTR